MLEEIASNISAQVAKLEVFSTAPSKFRRDWTWRSRQKYDKAFLSMIYLSGEGKSGALNVKGNFHRSPHRGAGVMFGPSARSLPTRVAGFQRDTSICQLVSLSSLAISSRLELAECVDDQTGRIRRDGGCNILGHNRTHKAHTRMGHSSHSRPSSTELLHRRPSHDSRPNDHRPNVRHPNVHRCDRPPQLAHRSWNPKRER